MNVPDSSWVAQRFKNVPVALPVAERLKIHDIRKLGNFKNLPEMLRIKSKYLAGHPKWKIRQLRWKIVKIQLLKILQKNHFHLVLWTCLQYFVQEDTKEKEPFNKKIIEWYQGNQTFFLFCKWEN